MKTLFIALFLFNSLAYAGDWATQVIKVYDGDTFTIKTCMPEPLDNISIRIRHIDTPELGWRSKCPQENSKSQQAKDLVKELIETKTVILKNVKWDKYSRIDADVFVGGTNVGELLINRGLAMPYEGLGPKTDWCK